MKTCCGHSLEAPRQGPFYGYIQNKFLRRNKENISQMAPLLSRAQLFKTNDVVNSRIIKTLIIKYHGIYANIFAEKM